MKAFSVLATVFVLGSTVGIVGMGSAASASPAKIFNGVPTELTAPDGVGGADFGYATAVSGTTSIFGAFGQDAETGAAYIFSGSSSTQQAELTASDGQTGDHFGESVAIDGDTAAVGAPGFDGQAGAVYVFGYSGGTWIQQAELTASDAAAGDGFGSAIALSGTTLMIGAPGQDASAGAAYVFTGSGPSWTQQQELTAPDAAAGAMFGSSIAVDGSTAVLGAPNAGTGGAAYVFDGTGPAWSEQAELSEGAGAVAGDDFGYSVAVSGSTAFVGAPGDASAAGAVYLFASDSGAWPALTTLIPSDGRYGYRFGISVTASGTTALVGSSDDLVGKGLVYAYGQTDSGWVQQAEIKAHHGKNGNLFGESVALSGSTAAIGAYGASKDLGGGYIFNEGSDASAWTQVAEPAASDGQTQGDIFGRAVALSGDTLVVGAPNSNQDKGTIYIYSANGSAWSLDAEFPDPNAHDGDYFGQAVAISGNTIVVGSPGTGFKSLPGTAYVYKHSKSGWALQSTLSPESGPSPNFGSSVAVSGSTALVGGGGAATVFTFSGGVWSATQQLTSPDGTAKDLYGFAVGISSTSLVVGAPAYHHENGIAYFYGLSGGTWTLENSLAGSNPAGGNYFGSAVAVSGMSAVVGAPGINIKHVNGYTGTAYIFTQSGGTWSQEAEVTGSDLHNGQVFGTSVAINSPGTEVAVSAPGRVFVFSDAKGGAWSQVQVQAQPYVPVAAYDGIFGRSVAISGAHLVAGAQGSGSRAGAVFVTN